MKTILLALAATLLAAAPAQAIESLYSPPIQISGEDRFLECIVANTSNRDQIVEVRGYDETGQDSGVYLLKLDPWQVKSLFAFSGVDGTYSCRFDLLTGNREDFRATACAFRLSVGCTASRAAR